MSDNKLKYTVTPSVDFKNEIVGIRTEMVDSIGKQTRMISNQLLKLQDDATRKGLIALGWTPPK